jgi:hypothetical protein
MVITFPSNTKEIIDDIRGAIGRNVTFYIVASSTACSVCSLDPVTNTSTDSFCPVCSGVYWIETLSGVTTSGHITWGKADKTNWVTGGQFFEGDCRLQIEYTDSLVSTVDSAKYVIVDDKKLTVRAKELRGVPTLNRVVLTLEEEEE